MYIKDLKIEDVRVHTLKKFCTALLFCASVKSDCIINLSS